jgi:hypothetical protein
MVVHGELFGTVAHMMTDKVIGELVRESAGRASDGTCAHLIPEPATVHVKAGGSVPIGARLKESRAGTVKAGPGTAGGTVAPAAAQADPLATFTYIALDPKPAGGRDVVTFTHVSKQGRAAPQTVTVIYDEDEEPTFPRTISGTIGGFNNGDGQHTQWDGSVVLQLRGTDPVTHNPDSQPTYEIASGSVHWTSSLDAPCRGSGEGTLSASQLGGVITITPERTEAGWHWDMLLHAPSQGTTRTMPVNGVCPDPNGGPDHAVEEDANADYLALGYNTYGNHPTNYTSPDLVNFTGEGMATSQAGNQQWRWGLTGAR